MKSSIAVSKDRILVVEGKLYRLDSSGKLYREDKNAAKDGHSSDRRRWRLRKTDTEEGKRVLAAFNETHKP